MYILGILMLVIERSSGINLTLDGDGIHLLSAVCLLPEQYGRLCCNCQQSENMGTKTHGEYCSSQFLFGCLVQLENNYPLFVHVLIF